MLDRLRRLLADYRTLLANMKEDVGKNDAAEVYCYTTVYQSNPFVVILDMTLISELCICFSVCH